jgi:hypothetical protein
MSKHKKSYYEENYHMYKQPWEEATEGCWIIVKKDGCTSMKKIENAAYPELEYALVKYYDIVVERYIQFINDRNRSIGFSAAEIALDSAKKIRELVIQQEISYTNNTKGD